MADRYQKLEGQEPSYSNAHLQELNTAFGESEKTRTPLIRQGFWWLVTAISCASILVTIRIFEQKGNITNVQKHTFNTIITGLILGLGLNFFVRHHSHILYEMHRSSSSHGLPGGVQVLRYSLERENSSAAVPQRSRKGFD